MQGTSKSVIALGASSVARYCLPITAVAKHNIRTLSTAATTGSNSTTSTTSSSTGSSSNQNHNSVIPTLPEFHYKPETITIDAAAQALYAQLPRGEAWDRQPEDLRLMYGSDKESMVRCNCYFLQ